MFNSSYFLSHLNERRCSCFNISTLLLLLYLAKSVCLSYSDALQIKAKVLLCPWEVAVMDCNLLVTLTHHQQNIHNTPTSMTQNIPQQQHSTWKRCHSQDMSYSLSENTGTHTHTRLRSTCKDYHFPAPHHNLNQNLILKRERNKFLTLREQK